MEFYRKRTGKVKYILVDDKETELVPGTIPLDTAAPIYGIDYWIAPLEPPKPERKKNPFYPKEVFDS